ncbi:MAG TPA: hypothetical protein VH599_20195 [Ktedonobacterales bacterium]
MQQAPGYQEQEPLRREYIPQQPNVPNVPAQGQQPPGVSAASKSQAGPLAWSDWVRWGPIWSGFFTIVATLAVIGALGTAIGSTVWGSVPTAFVYGWGILTGIVAYFLGGWVTARAAGVRGVGAAILNSALAWALSLVAILVLVVIGAGGILGFMGANIAVILRTPGGIGAPTMTMGGNMASTAWAMFTALMIGLILAVLGGIAGSRPLQGWRGKSHAL